MTPPDAATSRNEAADRLRELADRNTIDGPFAQLLDAALDTERRLTVERLRRERPEWFPCSCHDAYKSRGLEAPDCPAHDIDRWLDEEASR